MWLADVSIRRPVFAIMLIGALVALGWISLGRIGIDLFPDVEIPYVSVTTTLEGASPETIETEVTDVLEEAINTASGIELLRSVSSEGLSQVFIEFALTEDLDVKAQDVRDKMALARQDLPSDVDTPIVEKIDPDASPIMSVMISGDLAIGALTDYADNVVKEHLQRLPGVGSVTVVGGRDRQIRIWLDAEQLRSYRITADDVVQALRREHAEIPGGRIETEGNRAEFGFKTKGEVTSVAEFKDIVVAFRNGAPTRLGDVALVEDSFEDERTYAELNGKTGISLDVRRQSGKNTVEVARTIRAAVAELSALAPPNTEIVIAQDIAKFIESSADDVAEDIVYAIILVAMVTLAFLLNVRATLIVAIAMPTALISTFFAFYVAGFTINLLTLLALSVAIGLLVDDAIVVLESIQRYVDEGYPPMEAASLGVKEVGPAVVAATVSIMAVFVPIAFMEGVVGQFFYEYGLAITFSVAVSLLVSLTLTPTLCARALKRVESHNWTFRLFDAGYRSLERLYARILRGAVRFRWIVIALALGSVFLGVAIAGKLPIDFFSRTDRSEFIGTIELPLGTGLRDTMEVANRVAGTVGGVRHVENVFFTVGGGSQGRVNEISFYIGLAPKKQRDVHQAVIMDEVRHAMRLSAPDAIKVSASDISWVSGGGISSFAVEYALTGSDLDLLQVKAEEMTERMRRSAYFTDIQTSYQTGKPEIQLLVDRVKAADLGVSVRTLATTARTLVGGLDVTTYEEDGERHDVRVRLRENQRVDLRKLKLMQVRAADGTLVDLDSIAELRISSGPAQIDRQSRTRKITVLANAQSDIALGTATDEIDRIVAQLNLPAGFAGEHQGSARRMHKTIDSIVFAFGLALLSLYMILASQFNSFVQPAIVMLTAPLSFVGAFASLYFADQVISLFVQIGIIALMGLVMKNGILLVDLANQFRRDGKSPVDAIIAAGPVRLRPVLMTAFSTIFGMIPVAISTSDASEMRNPLGFLIIGGMTSSTFLTLLVLPAAYVMIDDISRAVGAASRMLRKLPIALRLGRR